MFYNESVEFFNTTEADGSVIEQRVDSEFSNFVSYIKTAIFARKSNFWCRFCLSERGTTTCTRVWKDICWMKLTTRLRVASKHALKRQSGFNDCLPF